MVCSASPVALSRVASGMASYQAAYSAWTETNARTAACQRCGRLSGRGVDDGDTADVLFV
jgi:hypothetical protein